MTEPYFLLILTKDLVVFFLILLQMRKQAQRGEVTYPSDIADNGRAELKLVFQMLNQY